VKQRALSYLLPAGAILLLAFALRTLNLWSAPVFYDEAVHLNNAHRIALGAPFAGLEENKWFFSFLLAAFRPTGPEGLWVGRFTAGLLGALTTGAALGIGTQLGGGGSACWRD
jgi:hypothetical protein